MGKTVLMLLGLLVLAAAVDYCEVTNGQPTIYIQDAETRLLDLTSYVQGYDLDFTSTSQQAEIYNSYQIVSSHPMGSKGNSHFNSGLLSLKSVDVNSHGSMVGLGKLSLLVQDSNQSIAVWVGDFGGFEYLPDLTTFKNLTLPSGLNATCFDLRSINAEGDAILNCQTISPSN